MFYRLYKKRHLKYSLGVKNLSNEISSTSSSNGVSLKEEDFELKEKTIQSMLVPQEDDLKFKEKTVPFQSMLVAQTDKPPIQQTSFCEH